MQKPLRPSEISYLLFQKIMEGVPAEEAAPAPKRRAARTANKVVKKDAPKKAAPKKAKKAKK